MPLGEFDLIRTYFKLDGHHIQFNVGHVHKFAVKRHVLARQQIAHDCNALAHGFRAPRLPHQAEIEGQLQLIPLRDTQLVPLGQRRYAFH